MEVKIDKRYPVDAGIEQAWSVLRDIRAVAACMPGAQITGQVDDTHFKGSVKSKVGPAVMSFAGDIELQALDVAARSLQLLGKGADKAGSSASMQLAARLEHADDAAQCVLVGQATVVVAGKLAQFGSRLLVPVSDALLAQFAANFGNAAKAQPAPAAEVVASPVMDAPAVLADADAAAPPAPAPASAPAAVAPAAATADAPANELNAAALMWTVFKNWLAGLFGGKR